MLRIIDVHMHVGPCTRFYTPCGDVDSILSMMDDFGIQYAFSTHAAGLAGIPELGENLSVQAFAQSKGRILSYLVYNPMQIVESMRIIEANIFAPFFVGIKIHPTQHNRPADDERYRPVWELAHQRGLILLAHTWDRSSYHPEQNNSHPDLFEKYISSYPNARIILGHAGGHYSASRAVRLVKKYNNVWVDISGDSYALGRIDYLVGELGSKRVLFGSDMPWAEPEHAIGEILATDLNSEQCEDILGMNAVQLFNLPV